MFTIKHIDEHGAERLWNADHPSFMNGTFTSTRDGETSWVRGGTIYVMNDKGSTVATYRLAPAMDAQNLVGAFGTDSAIRNQRVSNADLNHQKSVAMQNEAMNLAFANRQGRNQKSSSEFPDLDKL